MEPVCKRGFRVNPFEGQGSWGIYVPTLVNEDFLALLASHTGRKVGSSDKRKPIGLPMQLPALDGELLHPKV